MVRGKFIVLEGADGAGTTTIANYLTDKLETKFGKRSVVLTHEPSDFDTGVFIREILRSEKTVSQGLAMAYLFIADRIDHTKRRIIPALEAGKMVVCDRYYFSTLVYQSVKDDFSSSWKELEGLSPLMRGHIEPDLSLLLDCRIDTLRDRRENRNEVKEIYENDGYQKIVVDLYRALFSRYRYNSEMIDAEESLISVKAKTWAVTKELFS